MSHVIGAEGTRKLIRETIETHTLNWGGATKWRKPLVSFVAADDPRFAKLLERGDPVHALPGDVLPGARSVVSFFLPFDRRVVAANRDGVLDVARQWAVAYVETNALIGWIAGELTEKLRGVGVRAAAEPATGKFDRALLTSSWSHKSVAVIAGLGSIGVHHMLITDSGCAGRLGSVVVDADLATEPGSYTERCRHRAGGICLECVKLCPVGALRSDGSIDRQRCWSRCLSIAAGFTDVGVAQVCGKCATGPCALGSAA